MEMNAKHLCCKIQDKKNTKRLPCKELRNGSEEEDQCSRTMMLLDTSAKHDILNKYLQKCLKPFRRYSIFDATYVK